MAPKGNNMIPNGHFHKHWQKRIRTWFNQPARKVRRRENRAKKAASINPRPVAGALRPMVHCTSSRHNLRVRLGRGFTLQELKEAGISRKVAPTIGIAVDHRRTNKSQESLKANVNRLKKYQAQLILFPKKLSAPKKGDSSAEELKVAAQLRGKVFRVSTKRGSEKPRAITEAEKKLEVFRHLRRVRADQRFAGKREKKAKEAQDDGTIGKAK